MNSVSLELLSKYAHDLTPIVNESPSRLTTDGCPETMYIKEETVTRATYLAILKISDADIIS